MLLAYTKIEIDILYICIAGLHVLSSEPVRIPWFDSVITDFDSMIPLKMHAWSLMR